MSWTQYEVWTEADGHQDLIETTHSEREAVELAKRIFDEGEVDSVTVYQETANGDYLEIMTLDVDPED
jgi:hypothetical protein